jgi:hypothetical protein
MVIKIDPKNYIPLKRAFEKNKWEWKESEELFKCISFSNKGNMFLYNYNDNAFVERNHPVLVKCRGLVVDSEGKILNFPFERFFNDWEKEKAIIDWKSAEIQSKIDGSLISCFWNGNDWEITTRGSFYPNVKYDSDFSRMFKKHFKRFDLLDKNFSYIFELVTRENRIVTYYDHEAVYLIGIRDLTTLKEVSQKILDETAKILKVKRPKKYSAENVEQCKKLFENMKEDEEGLVIVDKDFNRVKIKQESYLKLARISMLNEQDIFEYVLGYSQIDIEFINRLPEVEAKIEGIRKKWNKIMERAKEVFEIIKDKPTRKEFAIEAVKYPFNSILFSMLDKREIAKERMRWDRMKNMVED